MNAETVGRPMEILLVEDRLADARLAILALRAGPVQHRLTLVRDGVEALEFLSHEGRFARAPRPDLILLDLDLPRIDGRAVLAELKANYELARIPVVILTASHDDEDRIRGELLHVEGYMVKPVELDKFLALVKQLRRHWLDDLVLPGC